MDSFILTLDVQLLYGVIIELISTGILFLVLSKILYKPVTQFLQNRRERIANDITQASNKLATAETLRADYEVKLEGIEKEKATILEEARDNAKAMANKIIEDAKADAEQIKNRANLEVEREKEKAKDDIKVQIIEVSSLIASKFISEKIKDNEQDKLVDQVISDLGEVKWNN